MTFPNGPPRLSIVVNNYNYARYLREALDSVIRQMRPGDELIVVDDGSTDGSSALLRQYESAHGIKLIEQANCGQMATVRVGIEAAEGDVAVLLDSDDYFLDGYLDRLRDIYSQHPDVSFVFANACISGDSISGCTSMRRMFHRLELPPGRVGTTKWAALLFYEFVGLPTSGLSLHRSLASKIFALSTSMDHDVVVIPPLHSMLLRISKAEQAKSRVTADGVIVRCASIFEAQKYYEQRPGFMYRIHGDNLYATTSRLGRWYLLRLRRRQFRRVFTQIPGFILKPTALELRGEILGRTFGRRLLRRILIRGKYGLAVFSSTGSVGEKLAAFTAALGFGPRKG